MIPLYRSDYSATYFARKSSYGLGTLPAGRRAARPWRPRPRRLASAWVLRESLGGASDRARVSLRQVNTSCWRSQCAAFGRSYVHAALEAGASGFAQRAPVGPPCRGRATRRVRRGAPRADGRLIEEYYAAPGPGSQPTELGALTEREAEVLGPNAHGLSNTEIARHRIASQATVTTHVNRILSKLDLRDRVQAVVLAYECGLVRPGEPRPPNTLTGLSTGHAPAGPTDRRLPSRSCICGRAAARSLPPPPMRFDTRVGVPRRRGLAAAFAWRQQRRPTIQHCSSCLNAIATTSRSLHSRRSPSRLYE
jgi:DNA-binding CsgD family transcriptional regulator